MLLIEDADMLVSQYEVIAGRWPESHNECIVVLDGGGGISDYLVYLLGLRDQKELEGMIKQLENNEDVTTPEDTLTFTCEQLMTVNFKVVPSARYLPMTRPTRFGPTDKATRRT